MIKFPEIKVLDDGNEFKDEDSYNKGWNDALYEVQASLPSVDEIFKMINDHYYKHLEFGMHGKVGDDDFIGKLARAFKERIG